MSGEFWFWGWLWTYLCAGACIARTDMRSLDAWWERVVLTSIYVLLWPVVFVLGDKT